MVENHGQKVSSFDGPNLILQSCNFRNSSVFCGDEEELNKGDKSEYETVLIFKLPIQKNIEEGHFQIRYNEDTILVHISKIQNKSQDPILQMPIHINFQFELYGEIYSIPSNAISDNISDNRGKYPCFLVDLIFPYRLDTEDKYDWEKMQVVGQPLDNNNKIITLLILNKLFPKIQFKYDNDVNELMERYFMKKDKKHLFTKLNYLLSEDAFKDLVSEYFFGCKFSEIPRIHKISEIKNEEDLLREVTHAIEIIKHYTENRYVIQPFWDNSRIIKKNKIPAIPKKEPFIQPTIQLLLRILLSDKGIHVERETNEGVGLLDFKCLYTTTEKIAISISVEFKLAHNKDIEHGLTKQLPAYMLANNSRSGIFVVMWFKDENGEYFKEPNRSKSEFINFLEETSKTFCEDKKFEIKIILIDTSKRLSASNL